MRAAQLTEIGVPPAAADIDEPDGDGVLLEVEAVALNPIDIAVGAGRFYGGHPPLPYVPGCEAVGRVDGRRVYAFGDGRGVGRDGFCAERVRFPQELLADVPDGLDPALAVACGIAGIAGWIAVAWRAQMTPDDRVLVLGATGVVGSVAVQAAKLLGAERVVAAGRRREALDRVLELGADAAVALDDLAAGFEEGSGPTVVIDPLWGEPVAAAAAVAAPNARIVHIGQSAGPVATLTSAVVRGKQLQILGHSNFALTPADRARAYAELVEHAAAGLVAIDVETFALDDVAAAWELQASGAGKAVVLL